MIKRNSFKQQLEERRRQAAAQSEPVEPVQKDPSEMTDEELDRELQKTDAQLRKAREQVLEVGREQVREQSQPKFLTNRGRPAFLPKRSRKRPWK